MNDFQGRFLQGGLSTGARGWLCPSFSPPHKTRMILGSVADAAAHQREHGVRQPRQADVQGVLAQQRRRVGAV